MLVHVYGVNIDVEIDPDDVTFYKTDDLYYPEAYQLNDGRWIGYDDNFNGWVMLG